MLWCVGYVGSGVRSGDEEQSGGDNMYVCTWIKVDVYALVDVNIGKIV